MGAFFSNALMSESRKCDFALSDADVMSVEAVDTKLQGALGAVFANVQTHLFAPPHLRRMQRGDRDTAFAGKNCAGAEASGPFHEFSYYAELGACAWSGARRTFVR